MNRPQVNVDTKAVVSSYPTYEQAQHAMDFLSDNAFPVHRACIVGSDLKMVETVLGRMSNARAAATGAATGAWFGFLASLLLAVFAADRGSILAFTTAGLIYGALFGAAFGLVTHLATGGRRDFFSHSAIIADRYDILVDHAVADDARNLLIKHDWRTS
ncbi:general stress protein [Nonomuraea africana]|uniref:General stress protein 17M-like domain-containing protein n=1 Tax=Nonomuraea africana TaxID=46171 RepID=A0ABR9KBQ4_9ACTN|nr:general stress protein [Nonomuraea africana]MBE1559241.1 hypothetical protein [Nonomuraea africana]